MKTKLEIHQSAAKFAAELLDNIPAVDLDKKIIARAAADKVPDTDYPAWKTDVLQLRGRYLQMKTQATASAKAAQVEAKKKAPAAK